MNVDGREELPPPEAAAAAADGAELAALEDRVVSFNFWVARARPTPPAEALDALRAAIYSSKVITCLIAGEEEAPPPGFVLRFAAAVTVENDEKEVPLLSSCLLVAAISARSLSRAAWRASRCSSAAVLGGGRLVSRAFATLRALIITGFVGTGFPLLLPPATVAAAAAWEGEDDDAPAADFLSDLLEEAAGGDESFIFWRLSNSA